MCQGPVDVAIKVSLTGRNGILNIVKKMKTEKPKLHNAAPEAQLKKKAKICVLLPNHLDTL